jgi:hypothetical protein
MGNPTPADLFRSLWQEGFFGTPKQLSEITIRLSSEGYRLRDSSHLTKELVRSMQSEKFLTRKKSGGQWCYAQSRPPASSVVRSAQVELFDETLINRLGEPFDVEFRDLRLNFGKSGNCTAFLLRKILEKLIYIVFAKNDRETKLESKTTAGRLVGLETMIEIAAREKIGGISFLSHKTAQEIRGVKFLGDASAHNPLTDVDTTTILPQLPFIITAYKELARLL